MQTAAAQAEMALIDDDITRRLTETKKRCKKELAEQKEKNDKKVPAKSLDARIADWLWLRFSKIQGFRIPHESHIRDAARALQGLVHFSQKLIGMWEDEPSLIGARRHSRSANYGKLSN